MKWIEILKPNDQSKVRLFCFHHAGGGASTFNMWANNLPENIELITVQLPGRENRFREPLLQNMEDIVYEVSKEFKYYLEKRFVLFGHSLGAKICFELTKALRNCNLTLPSHLIVSGCEAPHLPFSRKPVHMLPDHELISELKIYNGTPSEILDDNSELIKLYLPIIRADFKVSETYQCKEGAPFSYDITAISGKDDPVVEEDKVQQWSHHTLQGFRFFSVTGDHFFIKSSQDEVLKIIRKILMEVEENENLLVDKKATGLTSGLPRLGL